MKKILIIIGSLRVGGAEKIARDIGKAANQEEFEFHYLVYGDEVGDYEAELLQAGCLIHHLSTPETNYARFVRGLFHLIKKNKYDIIHAHTMHNSGWAVFCGRILGVRNIIVHSHSFRGNQSISTFQHVYNAVMRFIIQRHATSWVACGELAGEWLFGKRFFKKNGQVIINGIDTERFRFSEEKRNSVRDRLHLDNAHVIGHVGHLLDVKNQVFLIQLLPKLLQNQDTKLLLLGDGENLEKLRQTAKKLNVLDHISFLGNVSDVESYLPGMDVFAFPSLFEGTPLAVLEAQANGLHCVISEYVPDDVIQTDLITKLPLADSECEWLNALSLGYATDRHSYAQKLYEKSLDTKTMLEKIFNLYRRN